jgi:NADH dehydrogenase FAD-containing subunit
VHNVFAVGDAASWPGIKRAGNALIMGQYAATNIVQSIVNKEKAGQGYVGLPDETSLVTCPQFQPMMALTIGDEAICYTPSTGLSWGKEIKDEIVGRGMGIDSKFLILFLELK